MTKRAQHNRHLTDQTSRLRGTASDFIPEDVLAELDAEERGSTADPLAMGRGEPLPEDVLAERDQEARLKAEELRQTELEGQPPAEDDPRY